MSGTLQSFINHARVKGLDYATVRQLLLTAGWKEKDVARAFAAESLDVAVPEPTDGGNARDSFIYLMSFTSLYVVVTSVIVLYYTFLDYLYPDPAWGGFTLDMAIDSIRYAIAAIIVAFPLFLVLSLVLERVAQRAAEAHKNSVARWLSYLTMFLAAAVLLCDSITLLYYFLDGSLTTRFVLKVVVLFVIAQVIFSYYYLAPRSALKGASGTALRRLLEGTGVLVVAGAIVLGFTLAGSPFTARQSRMDEKRLEDLRAIHAAIKQMTTSQSKNNENKLIRPLPNTLAEVADFQRTRPSNNALDLLDPETREEYSYKVTGEKTYELCAHFALERNKKHDLFWNHPPGKHCFQFKAESSP